jgi:hypothetical protein
MRLEAYASIAVFPSVTRFRLPVATGQNVSGRLELTATEARGTWRVSCGPTRVPLGPGGANSSDALRIGPCPCDVIDALARPSQSHGGSTLPDCWVHPVRALVPRQQAPGQSPRPTVSLRITVTASAMRHLLPQVNRSAWVSSLPHVEGPRG